MPSKSAVHRQANFQASAESNRSSSGDAACDCGGRKIADTFDLLARWCVAVITIEHQQISNRTGALPLIGIDDGQVIKREMVHDPPDEIAVAKHRAGLGWGP